MCPSPLAHLRVGIIVPRHGHTAVMRNLLKRRLRDLMRLHVLDLDARTDIVVLARPDTYTCSFAELERDILRLVPVVTERPNL
jgi:ribonuclease P protein component